MSRNFKFGELTKNDVVIGKRYRIDHTYYYVANASDNWVEEAPLCQYSKCICKTKLVSWAKVARCPKCGFENYLT